MNNLWALGMVLAITQLINLTYIEGLASDFSDVMLEASTANETFLAPYQLVDKSDGEWALLNATLPEGILALHIISSSSPAGYSQTEDR